LAVILITNLPPPGKYYDSEGNLMRNYLTTRENWEISTKYYDLDGSFIGECHIYSGPGSSGYKGGCTNERVGIPVSTDSNSVYSGMLASRYECVMPD